MYLPTHVTSLINWYPEQQISVLLLLQNLIIVFICLKTFDQVYLILLLHKFQTVAYCVQNGCLFGEDSYFTVLTCIIIISNRIVECIFYEKKKT